VPLDSDTRLTFCEHLAFAGPTGASRQCAPFPKGLSHTENVCRARRCRAEPGVSPKNITIDIRRGNHVRTRGRNVLVLRSSRYSGDGGVDGTFWCPEAGWYAVQVKGYSGHINRQHVNEFTNVVRRSRYAGGMFAHTGRGCAGVYEFLPGSEIILLSGDRLIQLIVERELVHRRLR